MSTADVVADLAAEYSEDTSVAHETVRDAFEETGWVVERATRPYSNTTRLLVFYYRPLDEVIAAEHPNGRGEFSPEDIFSWYVGQSVRGSSE